jgi:ribonuclease VapC
MIVDASAILAILLREPERYEFRRIIAEAAEPVISPFNFLEASVRADKLGEAESKGLDAIIAAGGIDIVPTTAEQAMIARDAYARYGKGNHPAKLNLGDCFAYALAKARSEPLLFKGEDFRQTDIEAAI